MEWEREEDPIDQAKAKRIPWMEMMDDQGCQLFLFFLLLSFSLLLFAIRRDFLPSGGDLHLDSFPKFLAPTHVAVDPFLGRRSIFLGGNTD